MAAPVGDYEITEHAAFEMHRRGYRGQHRPPRRQCTEQRHVVRRGRDVLQSRIQIVGRRICFASSSMSTASRRRSLQFIEPAGSQSIGGLTHEATYDARTDTLRIILKADVAIVESDEDKRVSSSITMRMETWPHWRSLTRQPVY